MSKQIIIIGLGQFGMSLASALSEKGMEVLAVDMKKTLVQEAAEFVTEAVLLNATEESELARLEPGKRDSAICAIGYDSKEASIVCTALLRQMGSPLVIARGGDKMHERILKLVGAHEIINPERDFGRRFANRLIYRDIIADTNLGEDLHLTEISVLPSMIGKNLIELSLPKTYGIMIAGIRRGDLGKVIQPRATDPLLKGDNLIIVSSESAIEKLIKEA